MKEKKIKFFSQIGGLYDRTSSKNALQLYSGVSMKEKTEGKFSQWKIFRKNFWSSTLGEKKSGQNYHSWTTVSSLAIQATGEKKKLNNWKEVRDGSIWMDLLQWEWNVKICVLKAKLHQIASTIEALNSQLDKMIQPIKMIQLMSLGTPVLAQ